jgi:hypothetical protein
MSYLDSRARNFKAYSANEPLLNGDEGSIRGVSKDPERRRKFYRIVFAVTALAIVAGMHHFDTRQGGRRVKFQSTSDAILETPEEPGFLARIFCRGAQVPKFCGRRSRNTL